MSVFFSVIVPVYNSGETIERCIVSIKNQTFNDWELILIDDGSKDNSLAICRSLVCSDQKIKIISKQNGGVSSARNAGLMNSEGKYVVFLDGDDEFKTDLLEQYYTIINNYNVDVIIGTLLQIDSSGNEVKKGPEKSGFFHSEIWNEIAKNSEPFGWAGGKAFRRKLLVENHLTYNEAMASQEDLHFNLRAYKYCNSFYVSEYPGYLYYYTVSNRKPPIVDFVNNQLLLYSLCKENGQLSALADKAIQKKLEALVYTYLFNIDNKSELKSACNALISCDNLIVFLKVHKRTGEKRVILHELQKNRWWTMWVYFRTRNIVKKLIKKTGK